MVETHKHVGDGSECEECGMPKSDPIHTVVTADSDPPPGGDGGGPPDQGN